ncbi:MAG TPA: hypothetical protein VKB75_17125 [Jatrophihabitans sp.]|nr:hypothetical protein [Jatrophihabitans sp.]
MPELDATPGAVAPTSEPAGADVAASQPDFGDVEPVAATPIAEQDEPAAATAVAEQDEAVAAEEPAASPAPSTPLARALAELNGLDERELAEHPDVYERIHSELHRTLSSIDDA